MPIMVGSCHHSQAQDTSLAVMRARMIASEDVLWFCRGRILITRTVRSRGCWQSKTKPKVQMISFIRRSSRLFSFSSQCPLESIIYILHRWFASSCSRLRHAFELQFCSTQPHNSKMITRPKNKEETNSLTHMKMNERQRER